MFFNPCIFYIFIMKIHLNDLILIGLELYPDQSLDPYHDMDPDPKH